jgi:hypothetical protein
MHPSGLLPTTHLKPPSYEPWDAHGDEEREGLLSSGDYPDSSYPPTKCGSSDPPPTSWSRKKLVATAISLILLLICGAFARSVLFRSQPRAQTSLHFEGKSLRSNGTHDFKRTALIVSIDGLRCLVHILVDCQKLIVYNTGRADYLDRGLTPHLLDISKQGLRAKYMTPVFPVSVYFR